MLEELNLRVRTKYLAKLRNPVEDAAARSSNPTPADSEAS
jgi:hypothetical protein